MLYAFSYDSKMPKQIFFSSIELHRIFIEALQGISPLPPKNKTHIAVLMMSFEKASVVVSVFDCVHQSSNSDIKILTG